MFHKFIRILLENQADKNFNIALNGQGREEIGYSFAKILHFAFELSNSELTWPMFHIII